MEHLLKFCATLTLCAFLGACGGGNSASGTSSGTVAGIATPSTVTVVTAN